MTCGCGEPAVQLVVYVKRGTLHPTGRQEPMCATHVEQELTLVLSGLSMVDIQLAPLPKESTE